MSNFPKRVAIDLTPVLPGGDNGGAKIFTLDLIARLSELHPATKFILLTQEASHGELVFLDKPNVCRKLVFAPSLNSVNKFARARSIIELPIRLLPRRIQNFSIRALNKVERVLGSYLDRNSLDNLKFDLLFCPFTAPTYFKKNIPTVCTIYDLQYRTYPQFFSPEDVAQRDHTFIEACKKATMLAAISEYSRQKAIEHGNLDPNKVRTIYLRMAHRITAEKEAIKKQSTILSELDLGAQQYLLYPANFWKHKNHEMLITAFNLAVVGGLDKSIKLVLTGAPGSRRDYLINVVKKMGLMDRVLFPGYLPNHDLSALMSNALACIFPSLYEGFGLPVIEAMAAGIPVLCSNRTSLPEVANGAAILFDPRIPGDVASAITRVAIDVDLRGALKVDGVRRSKDFEDFDRMTREYSDAFIEACSQKVNPP